jgi:single-strand DNA-binding protein
MIHVAAYGRLGVEPRSLTTRTGKPMASASLAVTLDEQTEWFGLMVFGRQAEALLKHEKGQCLSVSGRLQRNNWTKDGQEHSQLQIVLDALISAKTVRPGGRANRGSSSEPTQVAGDVPFDDDIPF